MVLFAGYLANEGKKSTTIKSYMSAIKAVLKDDGVDINEDRFMLAAITKCCSFHNDCITTRLPIQRGVLEILVNQLSSTYEKQPYLEALYKALFVTAYFELFRVGELTKGNHPVCAKDVHVGYNKKKLMFVLHTSKTHWHNNSPQIIKISSTSLRKSRTDDQEKCCPFLLLQRYLDFRKPAYHTLKEQFFIFRDRNPVTSQNFRSVLKTTLEQSGFNYQLYNCSSFRSGRAVDLVRKNVSVESVRKLGRWRSSAIYRYLK